MHSAHAPPPDANGDEVEKELAFHTDPCTSGETAGAHAFPRTVSIVTQDEGISLGGSHAKLVLKKGLLHSRAITYVTKSWCVRRDARPELYAYGHAELLLSLQGIYVPRIIGISDTPDGGISCFMATPHRIGWQQAHRSLSAEIKNKVVSAYESIHQQGILHGHVALQHILIGDDQKVTIVDFSKARTIDDHAAAGLERCLEADLQHEMRKVRCLLDCEGASESESDLAKTAHTSHSVNSDILELRSDDLEPEAMNEGHAVVRSRFEIPLDKRSESPGVGVFSPPSPNGLTSPADESGSDSDAEGSTESPVTPSMESTLVEAALDSLSVSPPVLHAPIPVRLHADMLGHDAGGARTSCKPRFLPSPRPPFVQLPSSPDADSSYTRVSIPEWMKEPDRDSEHPFYAEARGSLPIRTEKRTFDVAFHPDTEDSSIWADHRPLKKRVNRPPTPFISSSQIPKDDAEPQPQFLSASFKEDLNPREPPPHRPRSISPPLPDSAHVTKPAVEERDETVVIMITSPTGKQRVWGVPETIASQISILLDQRTDKRIPEHIRREVAGSSSAVKRRAEEPPQVDKVKNKLLKRSRSFFSRLFE